MIVVAVSWWVQQCTGLQRAHRIPQLNDVVRYVPKSLRVCHIFRDIFLLFTPDILSVDFLTSLEAL